MLVEVRETIQLRIAVGVVLAHDVDLHFAEVAREGDLSAGRNILRRKEQHLVAQERLIDRAEQVVRHVVGEPDAGEFGAELRRELAHLERQGLGECRIHDI